MFFVRITFISLILLSVTLATCQTVAWYSDLEGGRTAATRQKRTLLLLFTAPGSSFAETVENWLRSAELQPILKNAIPVRLDINDQKTLADSLGVYRAGTIMLYDSDGNGLARIADAESIEDLKVKLTREIPGAPVSPTPAGTPMPTPPIIGPVTTNSAYLELPKGKQVREPIVRDATSTETINLGKVDSGKKYVLQLKGPFATRRMSILGSDPIYNFYSPTAQAGLTTNTFIRFSDGNHNIATYFFRAKLKLPPYTAAHTYDVPITGNGKELKFMFSEKNERNYTDNTGKITFTLFEALE